MNDNQNDDAILTNRGIFILFASIFVLYVVTMLYFGSN